MNNTAKVIILGLILTLVTLFVILALMIVNNGNNSKLPSENTRVSETTLSSSSAEASNAIDDALNDTDKIINDTINDLPVVDEQADFGL